MIKMFAEFQKPQEVICSAELSHCPLSESELPHQHCLLSKKGFKPSGKKEF